MPSFDVVSEVELEEVRNAVDQTAREISTRYDFKGSKSTVELKESLIIIMADDDMKLKAVQEILRQKLAKRGVDLKSVQFKEATKASGNLKRQEVEVQQGIKPEDLKKFIKLIKGTKVKVNCQVQGDQLRVMGKKRDDLQSVIEFLKTNVTDVSLQYTNFRD